MEWLLVPEVASKYRLGRSTIYLLIKRGDLPAVRFGSAIRVPSDVLAECLRQRLQPSKEEVA